MATVSEDCKYLQTTITFSIATEGFSCSGKTLISPGAPSASALAEHCSRRVEEVTRGMVS